MTTALATVLPIVCHTPAAAQVVPQVAEQARAFDIPSQGLPSALRQFASQSGLQLAYTTAEISGLKSMEMRGTLTPRQALARLLAGTGVTYRFTAPNVVALQRPGASDNAQAVAPGTVVLDPVNVEGQRETATGPVQGYVATRAATGTKTDTPLKETPQSITVVTADRVKDQGAMTVQESVRYIPGVTADPYGPDSRNDSIKVRGSSPEIYLDGMRVINSWWNGARADPYTLERIEVLRGPSSTLYGSTTTAGLINQVSKRPQDKELHEFGVQYGSFNRKQLQTDHTGKLSADGKWLYRFIGIVRESDMQTDYVKDDRVTLMPAITWRPTTDTDWTVMATYQKDKTGALTAFLPHSGTIFSNPNGQIPVNRFASEPGYDLYQTESRSVSSLFEHRFNEAFKVRQSVRYSDVDGVYNTLYPNNYSNPSNPYLDPAQRTVGRYNESTLSNRKTLTSDTNAELKFATGPISHTMLFGFDYRRMHETGEYGAEYDARPFDLYSPSYGGATAPGRTPIARLVQSQAGAYAQEQLKWGSLIGVVGVRYDQVRSDTAGAALQTDKATTGRAALMYELPFGITPYVSYAQSFNPVFGATSCVDFCKPQRGEQYEVGFKYSQSKDLVINGALFDTTEENRLATDPAGSSRSVQTGKVRIRGAELEVLAAVTRDLDLIGTYTFLDTEVLSGDDMGKRIETVPAHQASLWAKYRFAMFGVQGLTVGGGVRYIGPVWDGTDTIQTPGYALFDAMVGWENQNWRFQINGSNLADNIHLTSCLARGDCFYGSRRTILSSLTYKF
jgi:iron complex outermembrane receptor protein